MTVLRTERLVLRSARWADLSHFHAIMSNPQAMTYWSTPPFADLETTRAWFASMMDQGARNRDFVVTERARVIGKVGVWRLPEIGIILHPDVWGRGIAREALGAVIPHLFATSDTDRLTVDIDPRNAASLALFGGLGFVETGRATRTFRINDAWADSVYMALARPSGL